MKRYERFRTLSVLLTISVGLFGLSALFVTVALLYLADDWWIGTMIAYTPRYPVLIPIPFLVVWAIALQRYHLSAGLVMGGLFLIGPYMGFAVGFPNGTEGPAEGHRSLTVITHNMREGTFEGGWIQEWIAEHDAEILIFQECRPGTDERPAPEGWHYKSIESMCLMTKFPIKNAFSRDRNDAYIRNGSAAIVLFELEMEDGPLWLQTLHLETVRDGIEGFVEFGLDGKADVETNMRVRHWENQIAREWADRADGPLLVAGDFNSVDESQIFKTYWGDFYDAWQECGTGYGHTKHTRLYDARIDHVLMDEHFACDSVSIGDRRESDHSPVIAKLRLMR